MTPTIPTPPPQSPDLSPFVAEVWLNRTRAEAKKYQAQWVRWTAPMMVIEVEGVEVANV